MISTTLMLLAACGSDASDSGDPYCDDVPVVTWENWGEGFVNERCQTCHASASPDRNGAPEDVVFDEEADVLDAADRVLDRATGEDPTMPPAGGVPEEDLELLTIWLTCWEG